MSSFNQTTLIGAYTTPRFTYGSAVQCEWRGEVVVCGLTNARMPWPVGKRRGERSKTLVIYGGLVDALRRESLAAVCHWWGVTPQTVTKWRRELGIGAMTEGTVRLKSASAKASEGVALGRKRGRAKNTDPERRRKISESKKGKARPDHVIEAMRKGRTGKPQSPEARQRMSEAHRARGRVPGRAWTRDEDALLGELPDEEVARRTGRSVAAVVSRRKKRPVPQFDPP